MGQFQLHGDQLPVSLVMGTAKTQVPVLTQPAFPQPAPAAQTRPRAPPWLLLQGFGACRTVSNLWGSIDHVHVQEQQKTSKTHAHPKSSFRAVPRASVQPAGKGAILGQNWGNNSTQTTAASEETISNPSLTRGARI
ncbi:hypothetical protein A9K55_002169 [Cordyceps militaris]|uniref:Uncharacterized protein n=1 Tax=Cordyceps militaris TaxID=73501 RepID=A0A2H4SQG6_CORMI|nr:hypothetical protein A9K55_002169 [Cordyceps militaris]